MKYIYIGDIVNTHGLKGEIRILSEFKQKECVFKNDMNIYIGKNKNHEIISSYRTHKNYDMVTLKDKKHIDDVLIYKGEQVFVNRDDLNYDGYLNEDLIGLDVYCQDRCVGHVTNILKTNAHEILVIQNGQKHMVPNIDEFISNVDLNNKRIDINYIKGLIDEN